MRRTLLALTTAALAVLAACETEDLLQPVTTPEATVVPDNGQAEITVMTRNIYLGFDIDDVLAGQMPLEQAVPALLATNFPTRAAALAAEIAATDPDLIGLQEVINYRLQIPSDIMVAPPSIPNPAPNATGDFMDFLSILMATLQGYGLDYVVVANNPTTDVEVPVEWLPSVYADVRYTDHDVILARSDVDLGDVTAVVFDAALPINLPGLPPTSRPLGFVAVEAEVDGATFLFVSSHLETQGNPPIQEAQTQQLVKWTQNQKLPIILVGDFNSAANANPAAGTVTRTYDMLRNHGRFDDLWSVANPGTIGLTCCHAGDLVADQAFNQRIDLIMMDKVAARLVTDVSASLVGVNPFQGGQPRWASDHAGVVASFRMAY
jgi:endonuclease/exonuclease/phosphatase family metal-dependent hydrolase